MGPDKQIGTCAQRVTLKERSVGDEMGVTGAKTRQSTKRCGSVIKKVIKSPWDMRPSFAPTDSLHCLSGHCREVIEGSPLRTGIKPYSGGVGLAGSEIFVPSGNRVRAVGYALPQHGGPRWLRAI